MSWAREHCDALRDYHARGLSFAEIAEAINAKFKTAYSRNAAIGRARRMGLAGPERSKPPPKVSAPRLDRIRERHAASSWRLMPVLEPAETVKLRCVEIDPRHLSLIDLEPGDCRYPYGGDEEGEAIYLLRSSAASGFKLLHGTFPSEPRARHGGGTGGDRRCTAIGRGGLN
jgi:GcrA cell cycle regulator